MGLYGKLRLDESQPCARTVAVRGITVGFCTSVEVNKRMRNVCVLFNDVVITHGEFY